MRNYVNNITKCIFSHKLSFVFIGIYCILFQIDNGYAQSCGTGKNYNLDTINWAGSPPPIRLFDNQGKEFTSQDLIVPMNPQGGIVLPSCIAGKFTLVFDDNFISTGAHFFDDPNNPALSQERRECVCKVFEDISRFIQDPPNAIAGRVNISIRLAANPSSALAIANPYIATPFSTSNLVLDNEVYKTILTTQSSYLQYPNIVIPTTPMFHGFIAFDYIQIANLVTYHSNPTPTLPLSIDLYSITLHEAMHLLGCIKSGVGIQTVPNQNFPDYSRHDKFLRYMGNQQPYITQTNGVWTPTTPVPFNNTCQSFGSIEFHKSALLNQETSNPLDGHHFNCDPNFDYTNFDYVMNPGIGVGVDYMQRFPHEQERNWFCDIGYPLTNINGVNQYGDGTYTQHTYSGSCNVLCNVVGVSDVYNSLPSTVTPLANDLNVNPSTLLSEVIVHTPNAGQITNLTSTDFSFVPNCNFSGWVTLSYVPQCVFGNTTEAGGTSFIFIFVEPTTNLVITKTVEPPQSGISFLPGETTYYTITVNNPSNQPQFGLQIEDVLAADFDLSSFSSNDFSLNNNTINTPIFSIGAQQSLSFSYELRLNELIWIGCSHSIENCVNLTRNGICEITACNTITVNKDFLDIPNGTNWSSINPNINSGAALRIHGNLTIDEPAIFDGFEIQLVEDNSVQGQITIRSSQELQINQSYLYGCEQLWKGIVLEDGSSSNTPTKLYIDFNTTATTHILDAQVAVDAKDNTEVVIHNTHFEQNGIGINVHPTNQGAAALRVEKCIFDCKNDLLSEVFPGKQWSIAGIVIENIYFQTGVLPNAHNSFSNMPFGIMGFNARLDIQKCTFTNINTDHVWYYGNTPNFIDGTGIVCTGTWLNGSGNSMLLQKGWGENGAPSFSNCIRGIYASGPLLENVFITDNRMENVKRGIDLQNVSYATVSIQKNHIEGRDYGIMLKNGVKSDVTISKNYIYLDNPYPPSTLSAGMYINNVNTPIHLSINRNMIDINRNVSSALWIEGCTGTSQIPYADGATLENNGIRMLNGGSNLYTHNRRGICALNSPYIKILNHQNLDNLPGPNTYPIGTPAISGSAWNTIPANVTFGQTAMHIENCRNSLIQCNITNNTLIGMRFYNDCDNSEISGNEFNQHSYGLYIGAGSRIGQQDGRGNNWNWAGSANTGYIWGAWNANINPILSEIKVNDPTSITILTPGAYPFAPIKNGSLSINPPSGFIENDQSAQNWQCENGGGDNAQLISERLTENDTLIANDSLVSDIYPQETRWSAQRELYNLLIEQDSVLPDTGVVRIFYEAKNETNFNSFQAITNAQRELYSSTEIEILNDNTLQIQSLWDNVFENDSLIENGGLDSLETAILQITNEGIRQQIQSLMATNKVLRDSLFSTQNNKADSVALINANITTSETYEQNEKIVNDIYLATFGKNNFSLDYTQTAVLEAIAWQCPLAGGKSVYIARSMLATLFDPIEYNDDSLCLQVGIAWRMNQTSDNVTSTQSFIKVYPNPTHGKVYFELSEPLLHSGLLQVFDGLGRRICLIEVNTEETQYEWNTDKLSSGVYFYSIHNFKGRFIVIK